MGKYKALIGLEMHCEISTTNSKVFSSARNSFDAMPNSNIMPVDMGFPGTLPVVNKEAVRKSLMASIISHIQQVQHIISAMQKEIILQVHSHTREESWNQLLDGQHIIQ